MKTWRNNDSSMDNPPKIKKANLMSKYDRKNSERDLERNLTTANPMYKRFMNAFSKNRN